MCVAIEFEDEGFERVVPLYPPTTQRLPLQGRSGTVWMRWGSIDGRGDDIVLQRHAYAPLHFPDGGVISLQQLQAGAWAVYAPQPVRIVATRFHMAHIRGRAVSFEVPDETYIRGCVAQIDSARRLYVVTVPAPPEKAADLLEPSRWPRIVTR